MVQTPTVPKRVLEAGAACLRSVAGLSGERSLWESIVSAHVCHCLGSRLKARSGMMSLAPGLP